jgi:hypothetical protein
MCIKQIPSKHTRVTNRRCLTNLIAVVSLTTLYFLPADVFVAKLADSSYCLHHQLLGFGCPGCGLTRATYYFLHQNYRKAVELNMAVVFVFPALASEVLYQFKQHKIFKKLRFMLFLFFCLSLLTVYIIRFFHH